MDEKEYRAWITNLFDIIRMIKWGHELHPGQEGIITKTGEAIKKWEDSG